ncbi:LysR family transcriptional regulator [Ideonella sp. DXS22W]|uniref:LysR family transcriptional regulator n=1 Tax=Pseudaquabacterium inlustre TaxID=2984192 RepID=A0ABU9CMH4_9BURK
MRADPDALLLSMPMRYFAAVADAGSVSRAAQRLHVAGSAVSRQITALEDSLGVRLFQRAQRGMRLTEAGDRLAAHLRVLCTDAAHTLGAVRGLHDEAERSVRIACTEGFAAGLLPQALAEFRARQPQARLEIHVCPPDEVLPRLQRREADLGLLYATRRMKDAHTWLDRPVPAVALMRAGHPLAGRKTLRVAEAAGWPVLLGAAGTTARAMFETACAARGVQAEVVVSSNALAPMLPLLGQRELLIASQATAAPLTADGQLVAVPLAATDMPMRRLQLLSLRGRALGALAEDCVARLAEGLQRGLAAGLPARRGRTSASEGSR